MASLKEMRNRIASVKATRKITKAMQMVAAAKLRRAQDAATAARPYAERMARVLGNVNANIVDKAGASPLLVGTGKDQVHLLVVMTAERGLCGGFNSNIARLARQDAGRLVAAGKTVKMLMVGRKGADALRRDWGRTVVGPEGGHIRGDRSQGTAGGIHRRRDHRRHPAGDVRPQPGRTWLAGRRAAVFRRGGRPVDRRRSVGCDR